MLKKNWILLVICLSSVFSGSLTAYALEGELNVSTTLVSEDIKTYSKENISYYLSGILAFENKNMHSNDYNMLEPFQMVSEGNGNKTSIFPITENGIVKYVFYINKSKDGTYNTKISKFLADEIENLRNDNLNNESISFIEKNGDIYIEKNEKIDKIYTLPIRPEIEDLSNSDSLKQEIELAETENTAIEPITDISPLPLANISRSVTSNSYGVRIDWLVHETQGRNNWCSAYAAAMILNNKNDIRLTKVADMVKWGKKGTWDSFSYTDIIKYANTRGVYPYYVGRPMRWGEVETQAKKSNAIWGAWEGVSGEVKGKWHAIDVIGTYQAPIWGQIGAKQTAYFVWNPWYSTPELCNSTTNTYYIVGGSFVWRYSVTNW